jgi:hypothetical protein
MYAQQEGEDPTIAPDEFVDGNQVIAKDGSVSR